MIKYFRVSEVRNGQSGQTIDVQEFNNNEDVGNKLQVHLSVAYKNVGLAGMFVLDKLNFKVVTCILRPNGNAYYVVTEKEGKRPRLSELVQKPLYSAN